MIVALARRYRGRMAVAIVIAAIAIDLVIGPLLIANVTVPLLDTMVRLNPELQEFVNQALSVIP